MTQNFHYPHALDTATASDATKIAHAYQRAAGVPAAPLLVDPQGHVSSPELSRLREHVEGLQGRIEDAQEQAQEAQQKAHEKAQEVAQLEGRIAQGDVDAAARHSSASAELATLERTTFNLNKALVSLQGQLQASSQELDLHESLSGERELITAAQREAELEEAGAAIRAILEPLVRRYRASDNAFYRFAEQVRTLSMDGNTSVAFGGHAQLDGDGRSYNSLSFSGATVDRHGAHHVNRIMIELPVEIKNTIAQEIAAARAEGDN